MLISYLREYQLSMGIPTDQAYNSSFKILALLLVVGFILNLLVKPVNKKFGMTPEELKAEQGALKGTQTNSSDGCICNEYFNAERFCCLLAWIVVGVPITLGIFNALQKGIIIFL